MALTSRNAGLSDPSVIIALIYRFNWMRVLYLQINKLKLHGVKSNRLQATSEECVKYKMDKKRLLMRCLRASRTLITNFITNTWLRVSRFIYIPSDSIRKMPVNWSKFKNVGIKDTIVGRYKWFNDALRSSTCTLKFNPLSQKLLLHTSFCPKKCRKNYYVRRKRYYLKVWGMTTN